MLSSTLPPSISVIMAVYNGAEHLAECIDSILQQTFIDFEFIIVDDASSDATPQILADYASRDNRVIILTNETNRERCFSRNRAIETARADTIAIMDADDWAYPERFAKQYVFMHGHPEITVCGTWLESYETGTIYRYPQHDMAIRAGLLFDAMLAHPSLMFRKKVFQRVGGYDAAMPFAEDYCLCTRLAAHVTFSCLPEALVCYRTYPCRDRRSYAQKIVAAANNVRERQLRQLGFIPSAEDMQVHTMLAGYKPVMNLKDWKACRTWGLVLLGANERIPCVPQGVLYKRVLLQWYKVSMTTRSGFLLRAICHDLLTSWGQGRLVRALLCQSIIAFFVRAKNKLLYHGIPIYTDC